LRRPTLQQVFVATNLGLALLLGALFAVLNRSSRESLIETSTAIREEKTRRIAEQVVKDLGQTGRSLRHLEGLLREGALGANDPLTLEAALFAEVAGEPDVSELAFTHAVLLGESAEGVTLRPVDRWQVSVYRTLEAQGEPRIVTLYDHLEKGRFVRDVRERPPRGGFRSAPLARQASLDVPDPTDHDTFQSAALAENADSVLTSDLHWFQPDMPFPSRQRRVVLSGQRAVRDAAGRFLGVLRGGLLTRRLAELVRQPSEQDPHRVFFCDTRGRLISAIGPGDTVEELGNDLRVVARSMPPEVATALAQPALRETGQDRDRPHKADFDVGGRRYLATFLYLQAPENASARGGRAGPARGWVSQDWVVAIVAPESAYLGGLVHQRMLLLLLSLGIMAVILLLGMLTLRSVRRGLGAIETSTARMRDFDFSASTVRLPIRDLQDVGERLEVAKTAMRAMGRYVPVDLVRLLFKTGREPVLGGELCDVSLLFSDIEGFTALSERLEPNQLALALGRYLEAMTTAVHRHQGIIDKYIGDAIMAIWNAPTPCPEHTRRACEAALACAQAADALFASPGWTGLPRLTTRFGIHRDRVMVGHFGAPDRMSYTALGDGVNLASRLEGLNKQYGTTVLVSEAVRREVGEHFELRLLDRVAVKGKSRGIEVYELLGPAGTLVPGTVRAYERALQAHWARDFAGAAAVLETQTEDPPSRALLERCRRYANAPPPADWDGLWVATSK
jgi:adenylate cyclase